MIFRHMRKALVITAGALVALLGLILMPVPGPGGTPVFLAGLAILAMECDWAKEWLTRFKKAHSQMGKRKRRALTASLIVFYLVTSVVAWNWMNRGEQKLIMEKTDA